MRLGAEAYVRRGMEAIPRDLSRRSPVVRPLCPSCTRRKEELRIFAECTGLCQLRTRAPQQVWLISEASAQWQVNASANG
jgi:hypothetical protein